MLLQKWPTRTVANVQDYWQQVSQGFRKFLRGWKANDATDNRRS